MKAIRVVAVVICDSIEHNPQIFPTARGHGEFKGGWEFPCGKIEAGETPQQAVVREIREELDSVQWLPADVTLIDKIRKCME